MLSVNVRPPEQPVRLTRFDEALGQVLGVSVAQAHKINVNAPHWVAAAIELRRARGEHDRVATLIGPIDAACAQEHLPSRTDALRQEAEALGALVAALGNYLLDDSRTNSSRLRRANAQLRIRAELTEAVMRKEAVRG